MNNETQENASQEATAGLWKVKEIHPEYGPLRDTAQYHIEDGTGVIMALCGTNKKAAERIVACVNALKGLPMEVLLREAVANGRFPLNHTKNDEP